MAQHHNHARRRIWLISGTACLLGLARAGAASAPIERALADYGRPQADTVRDQARRPAEALSFAAIKPGDKVLELSPGDGYWTRILSKLVGPSGKIYAYAPLSGPPPWMQTSGGAPQNPIATALEIQHVTGYQNVMPILEGGTSPGIPAQADAVWTADAYHAFHNKPFGPGDAELFDQGIFKTLKAGGSYTIVDYAAAPGSGFSRAADLQRSDAGTVKAEVTAAGFVFDGASVLLANAGDDHTQPATAALLDGKPDQFMLRFHKPGNAANGDPRPRDSIMKNYFENTFILGTPEQRFRTVFFHPDHSRQEIGLHDMQWGSWYWDADGDQCAYHEAPAAQEGYVTCHPFPQDHRDAKLGDVFSESAGPGRRMKVALVKGHLYPNSDTMPWTP